MPKLNLTFILCQNVLYIIVKDSVRELDLNSYAFDSNTGISSGRNGNHLFKRTGPIKDARKFIKSKLSKMERLRFNLNILSTSGTFISDKPLSNLAIKHYCDFLEQANCKTAVVFLESGLTSEGIQSYIAHLDQPIDDKKIIGKAGPEAFSYWYKEPDNSIDDDGLLKKSNPNSLKGGSLS